MDNVITEKLCDDGYAFNDFNHKIEKCDFIYQVDCEARPELREFFTLFSDIFQVLINTLFVLYYYFYHILLLLHYSKSV